MALPVWRLTRRPSVRRVFYALAGRDIVAARVDQFEYALDPVPERVDHREAPPAGVDLRVASPGAVALPERMDDPHLTGDDELVVALVDGDPVGVQPVTVEPPAYVPPLARRVDFDGAYFWGLYVAPEWRRRGVATSLVTRALRFVAERTDHERVQTLVGTDNLPSKRLLRGVGFERTRVRSYYRLFGLERRRSRKV